MQVNSMSQQLSFRSTTQYVLNPKADTAIAQKKIPDLEKHYEINPLTGGRSIKSNHQVSHYPSGKHPDYPNNPVIEAKVNDGSDKVDVINLIHRSFNNKHDAR